MMWKQEPAAINEEPMIVKYVERDATGIVTIQLSRYAIGYVMRGTLYIYDGDKRRAVGRGDLLFLGIGRHYVEYAPEDDEYVAYALPLIQGETSAPKVDSLPRFANLKKVLATK